MKQSMGERINALREQAGWTQEGLATASGLSLRTIQRIESNKGGPSAESLQALAAVFRCDVNAIRRGLSAAELTALQDDFTCPHCGSRITEQTAVPHEYGDAELEIFACGYTRGWKRRPCPSDPRFPNFDDYDLCLQQDGDGMWCCSARGRTPAAQAVWLQIGRGRSEEEAKSQVLESYRAARSPTP
jgi:transcriptional regulator with XRE-family HTH domain